MNSFMGGNVTVEGFCPEPLFCFVDLTVVIAVTFLILSGNIGNLVVLLSTASLRNSHGYLLISLSVADLGIGVIAALSIYPAASFQGTADAWPYGDAACLATALTSQIFLFNSGNILTFLSIERYIAIVHPLKYARIVTKRVTVICITVGWIGSVAVYLPVVLVSGYEYVPELHTCMPSLFGDPILAALLLLGIIIPSAALIVVDSYIVRRKLKESERLRAEMARHTTASTESQESLSSTSRMSEKTLQLFRMVRVMTIAVIVSWMPVSIVGAVIVIAELNLPREIYFTLYWLLLANSFVNTVIYFLMNKTFHDRLNDILKLIVPRFCLKSNKFEKKFVCRCCVQTGHIESGGDFEIQNSTCQNTI